MIDSSKGIKYTDLQMGCIRILNALAARKLQAQNFHFAHGFKACYFSTVNSKQEFEPIYGSQLLLEEVSTIHARYWPIGPQVFLLYYIHGALISSILLQHAEARLTKLLYSSLR